MGQIDCLLIHVPKMNNSYKPFGDTLYVKSMAIGLLAMADFMRKNDIAAEVVHCGVEWVLDRAFDLPDYVARTAPLVAGFSLHWHPQSFDTVEAARALKARCPEVHIVFGGLTASYFADELMSTYDFIDGVIRGDGEVPITQLVRQLRSAARDLSPVGNLLWRKDGAIVKNELSYVADKSDIDGLEYNNYALMRNADTYINVFGRAPANYLKNVAAKRNVMRRASPSFIVPVARGCSANCKWCGGSKHAHERSSGRKRYVFRSKEKILNDMREAARAGFGIAHFAHYSHPNEDVYYIDLFRMMREQGIEMSAYFECSALPSPGLVDAFAETFPRSKGDSVLCLSRMAPNEEVRRMNVGNFYTNQELYDTLEYIDRKDVAMELTFTLGLPGEGAGDVAKLVEFRKRILSRFKHIRSSVVLTSQIEPGSFWYLFPEQFGIATENKSFADFYKFHSSNNSYYTHLGYYIRGYFDGGENETMERFRVGIQKLRCRHFCLLSGNSTAPWANLAGRVKCSLLNIAWKSQALLRKRRATGPGLRS